MSLAFPMHPRLVRGKPFERIAWLGDIHVPYHDPRALAIALEVAEDWRADCLLVGGDLFDCKDISEYFTDAAQSIPLDKELELGKPVLSSIDALGIPVVYLEGNHEARYHRSLAKAKLSGLGSLPWHKAAGVPDRWEVYGPQTHYRVGPLTFLHGDLKGRTGASVNIARSVIEAIKTSCVFGHYHKAQSYVVPGWDGSLYGAYAMGHLSDVSKSSDYLTCPHWSQGFGLIDLDHSAGLYEVRSVNISGGKARFNGKVYRG